MQDLEQNCILHQMAEAIREDPGLKAVWLDVKNRKISYAFQPGADVESTKSRLQALVGHHRPEEVRDCTEDSWRLACELCEHGGQRAMPAGVRVVPMPDAGILLEKETCLTARKLWRWREFKWVRYRPRVTSIELEGAGDHRRELWLAGVCGLATAIGLLLEVGFGVGAGPVVLAAYGVAYVCGGWFPAREVWALLRRRIVDVHFLMLVVAAGAAVVGHWWEGAILLFLFSLSGGLEQFALNRTRREINSLFHATPKSATVIEPDGRESSISVTELQPGNLLRVRPDEQFAADAEIVDGHTAVNESSLTGEAHPVDKEPGDRVFSGTLNLWGSVSCKVLRRAEESALAKVIRLIREAQESKAPSQRFTDRFGTHYTYAVLGICVVLFFIWWLGFGLPPWRNTEGLESAFYRTMTLLVVSSPCALVLSIPSAILAGIAAGARHGVLFRGGGAIENLAEVRRVGLDKTGTLTTGELEVMRIESYPPGRETEVRRLAAGLAQHSHHPVSRAIYRHAAPDTTSSAPALSDFRSHMGLGVAARWRPPNQPDASAITVRLGRRKMFPGSDWLRNLPLPYTGVTETILEAGDLHGRILFQDRIRKESRPLLRRIQDYGIRVTMLTGDRREAASAVAASLGVTDVLAELSPEQKVAAIQQWVRDGEKPAMVGDGVNDAPSLAAAHVGVGMGVRGSDAALEQADVVLMQDRLEHFLFAFQLSRQARRIIHQNLALSLGVITVLVMGALGAQIPLTLGVLGHEGSTVVVVFNSLRLLFFRPARKVRHPHPQDSQKQNSSTVTREPISTSAL